MHIKHLYDFNIKKTNSRCKISWLYAAAVKCNNCLEQWHIISTVCTKGLLYNVCNINHTSIYYCNNLSCTYIFIRSFNSDKGSGLADLNQGDLNHWFKSRFKSNDFLAKKSLDLNHTTLFHYVTIKCTFWKFLLLFLTNIYSFIH